MKEYTDTPVWNSRLTKVMWQAYLGSTLPEKVEYAYPAEAESYARFPPTYIEAAEFDALHDEAVILADRLKNDGVECTLHEVNDAYHGYESALKSRILQSCMNSRINWLGNIINPISGGKPFRK